MRMQGGIEVFEGRVGGASIADDGIGFILGERWLSPVPEADKIGGRSRTGTYSADIWTLTSLFHLRRRFRGTCGMRSTQQ